MFRNATHIETIFSETASRETTSAVAMSTETIERPVVRGPGSGFDGVWHIIVRNDDHNTFDGVAQALARTLPGVTVVRGYEFADEIHNSGSATVWSGQLEPAELYWEQLADFGLTMAPLAQS